MESDDSVAAGSSNATASLRSVCPALRSFINRGREIGILRFTINQLFVELSIPSFGNESLLIKAIVLICKVELSFVGETAGLIIDKEVEGLVT